MGVSPCPRGEGAPGTVGASRRCRLSRQAAPPREREGTNRAARSGDAGAPGEAAPSCRGRRVQGRSGSLSPGGTIWSILHISSFISPSARPRGGAPGAAAAPCPATPRGTGIRHYPGITGLSRGRLALYNRGSVPPSRRSHSPPSAPAGAAARRRGGGARRLPPPPARGRGQTQLIPPLAGRGRHRGVPPLPEEEEEAAVVEEEGSSRRLLTSRRCSRRSAASDGTRRDEGRRPRVPLTPHRGPARPTAPGRGSAAPPAPLPGPGLRRPPAGSTVENKSGLLIYCSGGEAGGGGGGVKGNQSPFSSQKRPFSPGSLRVTLVTTPLQPKTNKSHGAPGTGAPPGRATGRERRRRRDREEGPAIDGGRGAAPALGGDVGPSQRAPCLPCHCAEPRS